MINKIYNAIVKFAVKQKLKKINKNSFQVVDSAEVIAEDVYLNYIDPRRETCVVYFLNNDLGIIKSIKYAVGTINKVSVYTREIAKDALLIDASGIILCHTHPSYNVQVSEADCDVTNKIKAGLGLVDVHLFDHVIIGKQEYLSFKKEGIL